jgi:hypothetical protein
MKIKNKSPIAFRQPGLLLNSGRKADGYSVASP